MSRLSTGLMLLIGAVSGCTIADAAPPVRNTCGSDRDCASGEMCDSELRMCVSERSAGYQVVLRVTSPTTDTGPRVPPTRFGPFRLGGPVATRDLRVEQPLVVQGLVARRSGESGRLERLPAELLWTPVDVSEGPAAETLTATASGESTLPGSGPQTNFVVSLQSGTDYQLVVQPLGESVALVPPRTLEVDAATLEKGSLEIIYEEMEKLEGRLLTSDMQPQASLSVRAVHPMSGQPVSGRAVTDEMGNFELSLDAAYGVEAPYLLEVGPAGTNTWFGVIQSSPEYLIEVGDQQVLILPDLPPLVTLSSWVLASPNEPVGGAILRFEDIVELTRGDETVLARVTQHAESGTDPTVAPGVGRVEVQLWPGQYEVITIPPADRGDLSPGRKSGFAVVEQPGSIDQGGDSFVLPRRSVFEGNVLDADGEPLPGVKIRTVPLAYTADQPEVARYSRSSNSLADVDGNYSVPVDVGRYDLVFEPPEGSGFPWHVVPSQGVDSPAQTFDLDVQLASPIALSGTVTFEDGVSPNGATIAAFARVTDGESEPRYVQIARGTLGPAGDYRLFLPPAAPQ